MPSAKKRLVLRRKLHPPAPPTPKAPPPRKPNVKVMQHRYHTGGLIEGAERAEPQAGEVAVTLSLPEDTRAGIRAGIAALQRQNIDYARANALRTVTEHVQAQTAELLRVRPPMDPLGRPAPKPIRKALKSFFWEWVVPLAIIPALAIVIIMFWSKK